MLLTGFRRRRMSKSRPALAPGAPPPWPVDPELGRRVTEVRRRMERTRRELARHVLPDRQPRETKTTATAS